MFKDVASAYVQQITDPGQTSRRPGFPYCKAERTVTTIIIPNDIQEQEAVVQPPRTHGNVVIGAGHSLSYTIPAKAELKQAAEILNAGKKIAILIGAGAFGASVEVKEIAGVLGAGVAKALLGKAVLPDDLSYVTGLHWHAGYKTQLGTYGKL